MSALTVNLPDSLHQKAREVAVSKDLSMDALVTIALTQSLSRLMAEHYREERAARATGKGIAEFLEQVPDAAPPEWDQLNQPVFPAIAEQIQSRCWPKSRKGTLMRRMGQRGQMAAAGHCQPACLARAASRARVIRSRRPPSLRKSCSNRLSCRSSR